NRVLVGSGATIREMNLVRKHLSGIKGGRLGQLVSRTKCVALYISDVNTGDLLSIASNPLLPDDATLEEFYCVVERYRLAEKLPRSISDLISRRRIQPLPNGSPATGGANESEIGTAMGASVENRAPSTAGPGVHGIAGMDSYDSRKSTPNWFRRGNLIGTMLMDNRIALDAAAGAARLAGFNPITLNDLVEGKYEVVADAMIDRLIEFRSQGMSGPVCLISGGEVVCPLYSAGTGGRNQEFVLYCAAKLASRLPDQKVCILSCGTDGIDGNSPAAGAAVDPMVADAAVRAGLDPGDFINRNDSFSFFRAGGGLIITGPTGNNVRDIRLLLSY
ncbi:MAG: MOFRL family protein, partial [Blastocatellia bacterium]